MDYLENIENSGFIVVPRKTKNELPAEILKRYKNIPKDYLSFLEQFEQIVNEEDTVWFNSLDDFRGESETDFAWNAFEQMSLEAFEDDEDESNKIRDFWDNHIPILLSVTEYQYMAICLSKEKYGEIVYGVEPEFEEVSKVCDNFNELINLFEKSDKNHYLEYFM